MRRFLQTFVAGSVEDAFVTMLSANDAELTDTDLARLRQIIDEAERRDR
jgi:hypothetical protein